MSWHIKRIQIDGGFLDGMDLPFTPGFNVIIGERGTGKTSLLELIRFALGIPTFTSESGRKSSDHALSVLQDGRVTVTLADGEQTFTVSRSADDDAEEEELTLPRPIMFSQTEIETLGLQANGRISLIDSFIASDEEVQADEEANVVTSIRSFTTEIEALRREIEEYEGQAFALDQVEKRISELEEIATNFTGTSAEIAAKASRQSEYVAQISRLTGSLQSLELGQAAIKDTARKIRLLTSERSLFGTDVGMTPGIENVLQQERILRTQLNHIAQEYEKLSQFLQTETSSLTRAKHAAEEGARQLRADIEQHQVGATAVLRELQEMKSTQARQLALQNITKERQGAYRALCEKRRRAFDKLDEVRQRHFEARRKVAANLNTALGPRIRIDVEQAAQHEAFAAVLAAVLRGSGIRYGELSEQIATSMSPRELVEAAEAYDPTALVETIAISRERASRFLSALRQADLSALATVKVEDNIHFKLLDGPDHKDIKDLSTGQRCTVILPIVMYHLDRMLIIDQPEDHIDNAFIADTLIRAILRRKNSGQLIVTTHNANVPVIGDASRVVQLGSDGKRGFVANAGHLFEPEIVNAIATLLEGGREAFEQRAEFYKKVDIFG